MAKKMFTPNLLLELNKFNGVMVFTDHSFRYNCFSFFPNKSTIKEHQCHLCNFTIYFLTYRKTVLLRNILA